MAAERVMAAEQVFLEGYLSVEAALRAGRRTIATVYIRRDKLDWQSARLERLAGERGAPVQRVAGEEIQALASGQTHGGIVALTGPQRMVALEELAHGRPLPFVAMLDGIEDPFNFGQAVRALYAAGADGLVVRPRNWLAAAGVVARASAGASELLATGVAETTEAAADVYRGLGLVVACAAREKGAVPVYEADLARPLFLVAGGEKRGVTRSFRERADLLLEIPYGRAFDQSLGTAAAVAVLAFEARRQRLNRMD